MLLSETVSFACSLAVLFIEDNPDVSSAVLDIISRSNRVPAYSAMESWRFLRYFFFIRLIAESFSGEERVSTPSFKEMIFNGTI